MGRYVFYTGEIRSLVNELCLGEAVCTLEARHSSRSGVEWSIEHRRRAPLNGSFSPTGTGVVCRALRHDFPRTHVEVWAAIMEALGSE